MKPAILGVAALIVTATASFADTVAPASVVFTEDGAVAASLTGVAGDPVKGRVIVSSKKKGNCIACHSNDEMPDVSYHGEIGPNLAGVAERYSEAQLRGLLANAKLTFDGTMMPAFYKVDGFIRPGKRYTGKAADDTFGPLLEPQQIEDALAYLMTLK